MDSRVPRVKMELKVWPDKTLNRSQWKTKNVSLVQKAHPDLEVPQDRPDRLAKKAHLVWSASLDVTECKDLWE
jgi:hypothetical protein